MCEALYTPFNMFKNFRYDIVIDRKEKNSINK